MGQTPDQPRHLIYHAHVLLDAEKTGGFHCIRAGSMRLRRVCARHLASSLTSEQQINDVLTPVLSVTEKTQIGQGLLGRTEAAFNLGELIRELDEETTVAFSLVLW
ncbi:hypothetical protein HYQ46_010812 [Verticillium longisporum]|nr:hypothetical protein HYQ46_010812 [Verticillium longisporum]